MSFVFYVSYSARNIVLDKLLKCKHFRIQSNGTASSALAMHKAMFSIPNFSKGSQY